MPRMSTATAAGGGLLAWVAREEGFRATPYRCPAGFLSVGYGVNLDAGLSREEAELLLRHRLEVVGAALSLYLPWWGRLDEVRRGVLTAMAYQMGVGGLLKFKGTLAAVARGDWEAAARGMLASLWARQTPARAKRTAEAMRTGAWPSESN
jgi:lysozyme